MFSWGKSKFGLISFIFLLSALISSHNSFAATTEISGVLEAEIGFGDDFEGNSGSDIALATVEIAMDAEISEWFSGHIVLLHEEDDTPLEVDQGYITYGNSFLSSFSVSIGQQYLPFGVYETNLVSDPLTLEIGETRESAIVISYDGDLYASFFLFNGDMNEAGGDDSIDSTGFNVGYAYEGESINLDVGMAYISNIKDSDGFSDGILGYREETGFLGTPEEVEYGAGFAGHMILNWGDMTFIGEFVAAMDDFVAGEIAGGNKKPSATNLEFAYAISEDFGVALAFQNSVDLAGYLPESRFLLGMSYQIDEATSFAFELASDSDYSSGDGGTGESASVTTLQFATEF